MLALALQAEAGGGELEVAPGDLTAEERGAFERAVAAGALRAMVQPWQPWWLAADAGRLALSGDGTALVREAGGARQSASLSLQGPHTAVLLGPGQWRLAVSADGTAPMRERAGMLVEV